MDTHQSMEYILQKCLEFDQVVDHNLMSGGLLCDDEANKEIALKKLKELGVNHELKQRFDTSDAPIIMIRHGLSKFNHLDSLFPDEHRKIWEDISIQSSRHLFNVGLHPAGVLQAEKKGEWLNQQPLKMVLVSPMRRTLETAYHILKHNPQKETLEIVVHPWMMEILFGVSELIINYPELKAEFQLKFQQSGMNINFSLVDELAQQAPFGHFQLLVSEQEAHKQRYIEAIHHIGNDKPADVRDYQVEFRKLYLVNTSGGILEDCPAFWRRVQTARAKLKEFFINRQLYGKKLESQIVFIGHSVFMQFITGGSQLKDWEAENGILAYNCEVVGLQWDKLDPL